MNHSRLFERVIHLPRRIVRELLVLVQLAQYFLTNRIGEQSVLATSGPVVSLTTFDQRIDKVYFAIESIANGDVRPSRLILWIDDEKVLNDLPATIRRLQKRGLEVKHCRNYGPHKKYFPYVQSLETFDTPLVTADDDILYPRYWLKKMVEANLHNPNVVVCYGAYRIEMDQNWIGKYASFGPCGSARASFRHLALGSLGVMYPSAFLRELKLAGAAFQECCPKGDDLWLHVQAIRSGYKIRQIFPRLPYFAFQEIPGTQRTNLRRDNVDHGDGNDRQISATYKATDIQQLLAD